jgi:peptide/nickel transport system substrate-binding protein
MPGYRPYCPYSKGPRDGQYHGPELAKARELVRRSGTAGTKVVVTDVEGDYNTPVEQLLVDVLRSIGYRATLRELPASREGDLYDPSKDIQVEGGGWYADYPVPANFYSLVSCATAVTPGWYTFEHCDHALDARAAAANALLQTEPGTALRAWTRIDHDITDQGLLLPIDNKVDWWITSDRVGNYLTGVQTIGPLLSQLWVQ